MWRNAKNILPSMCQVVLSQKKRKIRFDANRVLLREMLSIYQTVTAQMEESMSSLHSHFKEYFAPPLCTYTLA